MQAISVAFRPTISTPKAILITGGSAIAFMETIPITSFAPIPLMELMAIARNSSVPLAQTFLISGGSAISTLVMQQIIGILHLDTCRARHLVAAFRYD